jgi:hypothetical protein
VRAGELSLCVGRICVVSAGGHMCLLCWRLVRVVRVCSLSDKTKPGR